MNKHWYWNEAHTKAGKFREIARRLGKEHAITKMMGSLAWGRYKAETCADWNLRDAVRAYGFLDGFFDCLNQWAADNDKDAQAIMLEIYSNRKLGR